MEQQGSKNTLQQIPTANLVQELSKREGVEKVTLEPYQDGGIEVNGPAVILVVVD